MRVIVRGGVRVVLVKLSFSFLSVECSPSEAARGSKPSFSAVVEFCRDGLVFDSLASPPFVVASKPGALTLAQLHGTRLPRSLFLYHVAAGAFWLKPAPRRARAAVHTLQRARSRRTYRMPEHYVALTQTV